MSASDIDAYFNAALNLAKEAGQLVRERIAENKKIDIKSGEIDLVTETDQQVEKLLITSLSQQFPDHKFIGEESVADGAQCNLTNAPTWIIDPIDGTLNFVHTFPHCCISIGLFIEQTAEIGIVYNPILEQLFTAVRGRGAFLNGKRIRVSGQTELSKSMVCFENGTSREAERVKAVMENFQALVPVVHGLRALGSAALNMSMVALGAADAYFEFGIHIWDIAAGELLVTEAGGVILDPSGGPIDRLSRRMLVAATPQLAEQLSQKLVQFYPQPRD